MLENEYKILRELSHVNIIQQLHFSEDGVYTSEAGAVKKKVLYSVLELAENQSLIEVLVGKGKFSEPVARYFFRQLIDGLSYIHSKGYCHKDIMMDNILLDRNFTLKICDFGFAAKLAGDEGDYLQRNFRGTVNYQAPEILNKEPHAGAAADIFSAGVALFTMVVGRFPFQASSMTDRMFKLIGTNEHHQFWQIHENAECYSRTFKDLLEKIFTVSARDRIDLEQIRKHPWLMEDVPTPEQVGTDIGIKIQSQA